ncbi:hypothetical protein ACH5RR_008823 [Cinchona calisaya]|uniref:Thioesterase domain-containing protein n=1 Tax=Cinchona calisaya TaxID=153742 RepID=A0ABD3ACF1_9GENT
MEMDEKSLHQQITIVIAPVRVRPLVAEIAALPQRSPPGRASELDISNDPTIAFGFVLEEALVEKVSASRTQVLSAGELGSFGAYLASWRRSVAGIQLSIHHLKGGNVGDIVHAGATPLDAGKTVQVWHII